MRGINYENRYLVILLSSVLNKRKIAVPHKQIHWQEVFKLAEFHHVVSPVYYGILGQEKELADGDSDEFYRKYHKELVLGEAYRDALEVILWQLKRNGIRELLLKGMETKALYSQWELGYTPGLEILVTKKDLEKIHDIMINMNYEQESDRGIRGRVYVRVPGIRVIFYDRFQMGNEVLCKYLINSTKKYFTYKKKAGIRPLNLSLQYLYYIGKYADAYMMGELKIRDVMDYYLYVHKQIPETEQASDKEILEKAGLTEFMKQFGILASLWFGQGREADPTQAFLLEEYIFSKGMEERRPDSSIIPFEKISLDFYQRDREEEWGKRQKEWMFPSREYMVQFFPILQKIPQLLWICWGIRGIRFFRKSTAIFIGKKIQSMKNRVTELKIEIIKKLKKTKEGTSEYEEHEDR